MRSAVFSILELSFQLSMASGRQLIVLHIRPPMFGMFAGAWLYVLWRFEQRTICIRLLNVKLIWHAKRC